MAVSKQTRALGEEQQVLLSCELSLPPPHMGFKKYCTLMLNLVFIMGETFLYVMVNNLINRFLNTCFGSFYQHV